MAMDIVRPSELKDDDTIVSAVVVSFFGHEYIESCYSLRFWDNGYGTVYQYLDAGGLDAIVRASTWEDAYECVIDEIANDADPDDITEDADGNLPEGIHWRGNGVPSSDWASTPIAQIDLNGEELRPALDTIDGDRYVYFLIVEREAA